MINYLKHLFIKKDDTPLIKTLQSNPFLVDVRTEQEFKSGHVKGSVNIPLGTVLAEINKFKNKKQIVVFCRSGNRSSMAKSLLVSKGITNVTNAGTWVKVNNLISK